MYRPPTDLHRRRSPPTGRRGLAGTLLLAAVVHLLLFLPPVLRAAVRSPVGWVAVALLLRTVLAWAARSRLGSRGASRRPTGRRPELVATTATRRT